MRQMPLLRRKLASAIEAFPLLEIGYTIRVTPSKT